MTYEVSDGREWREFVSRSVPVVPDPTRASNTTRARPTTTARASAQASIRMYCTVQYCRYWIDNCRKEIRAENYGAAVGTTQKEGVANMSPPVVCNSTA